MCNIEQKQDQYNNNSHLEEMKRCEICPTVNGPSNGQPHWVGRSHGTCCPNDGVSFLVGQLGSAHFLLGIGIVNFILFNLKWALDHVPSLGSAQLSLLVLTRPDLGVL